MIRIVLLAISLIYGAFNSVSGNINAPFRPGNDDIDHFPAQPVDYGVLIKAAAWKRPF